MELIDREQAAALAEIVERGLTEDLGGAGAGGDLTSEALFSPTDRCRAELVLEEAGVVCGLGVAAAVFSRLDPDSIAEPLFAEGQEARESPCALMRVGGRTRALLSGERLALNLLGRLSGIATLTRRFVDAVAGSGIQILHTRKTTPGLRVLERYAVRCGGGSNHRAGLLDAILVKDNHLRLAGGVAEAVRRLRSAGSWPLEVEADTLEQVEEALWLGVERILLDNMSPEEVARAVELVAGRAQLEASGGITLDNVRAYAEAGVNAISIGALTHSARSLSLSMEVQPL